MDDMDYVHDTQKPLNRSQVDQYAMDVANIFAQDGNDSEWELIVNSSQAMARMLLHYLGINVHEDIALAQLQKIKSNAQ